ncbi:serine hydrolase [Streptacidiphilus pinicola]|uniref:Serine hydrolase n=1 Tax=Streptacidiphilus pinicola TaxID=2219663 RepID=A0A2X0ITM2_9ACTN|nr:serine hydrolase domain-containing protein [Streptacidiphilus pinicola]RAG86661.1 serine hydrolase [Streptacidiphilus pinicola]
MASVPRCSPSAQDTDARGVVAFLDAIDGVAGIEPHSVMLLRHGYVIAEGWWAPYAPQGVQQLYSLGKLFTATAVGLARAEGRLDLDAPVVSYFPELAAEITDPRSRSILVRHIASMSAGHTTEQWFRALATDPAEPVRGFLLEPPDGTPGVTFAYSQSTTYTLAAIVQRVTGQTLTEFLRPRLFEPLGIGEAFWLPYPAGREAGFAGLHTTTEAVARLGQLYLQGGVWEGRQLLAPEWVAAATRAQVDNSGTGATPDWTQGYGFQFWMSRHGYRGDGAFGQFCVVLPEQDAVLALTAETENMQGVLDAAWAHLLPALGDGGTGSATADALLQRRLTGLQLPFPEGDAVPRGEFTAARSALPLLERITLAPTELTLYEKHGATTTLRLHAGSWPVTGHIAARATRTSPDTVVAHLQLVRSAHKLRLTCDLRTGTFDAEWRTVPLMTRPETPLAAHAYPTHPNFP